MKRWMTYIQPVLYKRNLGSNVVMHASVTANTTGAVAGVKRAGTVNPDFVQKHKVMTNVISDRPDESIVANVQHLQPR